MKQPVTVYHRLRQRLTETFGPADIASEHDEQWRFQSSSGEEPVHLLVIPCNDEAVFRIFDPIDREGAQAMIVARPGQIEPAILRIRERIERTGRDAISAHVHFMPQVVDKKQ